MVKVVYILTLLSLIAVQTVLSLECYECGNCGEITDKTKKRDCSKHPSNTTTSRNSWTNAFQTNDNSSVEMRCATVNFELGDGDLVYRLCSPFTCTMLEWSAKQSDIMQQIGATFKGCKECTGDLCNPASNIQGWAFSSIVVVAVIKLFL